MYIEFIPTSASGNFPISTDAAQAYANAEGIDAELFTELIREASEMISHRTHHYLRMTTLKAVTNQFCHTYTFPGHPITGISSIRYINTEGVVVEMPVADLISTGKLIFSSTPYGGSIQFLPSFTLPEVSAEHLVPVEIVINAGYTPDTAPGHVKILLRRMVMKLYEDREDPIHARETATDLIIRNMTLPL
jgi:hypothetical protein